MTHDEKVKILEQNWNTRAEAEKHLQAGTVIFSDFEEKFDDYINEWFGESLTSNNSFIRSEAEHSVAKLRNMVETRVACKSWGVVYDGGKAYYIMYVL